MWKRKTRKIKEELKANEILKLHTITFQESPIGRYRIPYGFDRNDTKESNLFCVHGYFYGGDNSKVGKRY